MSNRPNVASPPNEAIDELLRLAVQEDFGQGDLTANLLETPDQPEDFRLTANVPCVVAGVPVAARIGHAYDKKINFRWDPGIHDGLHLANTPQVIATIHGPLAAVLSAERVLLNFLQRLFAVATFTRAFVEAVKPHRARILDTRKTVPGWRALDKYAVRCGGGHNHRQNLADGVLIKDNHFHRDDRPRYASTVFNMLNRLKPDQPHETPVEVEADTLDQVEQLLQVVGVNMILLDNFTPDQIREAVALRDSLNLAGKVELEASGGITLDNVRDVAATGVERISVGALTHSPPAIDLNLERA